MFDRYANQDFLNGLWVIPILIALFIFAQIVKRFLLPFFDLNEVN